MRQALFLDRDGVLNKIVWREGKPASPLSLEEMRVCEDWGPTLLDFRKAGFFVCGVTNQPDVARGRLAPSEVEAMHGLLMKTLPLDTILVCPHDDCDACACRKPKPGLFLKAAERWKIDLRRSYVVGDTWRDVEAGRRAGCHTVIVDAPYNHDVIATYRVSGHEELVGRVFESFREKGKEDKA